MSTSRSLSRAGLDVGYGFWGLEAASPLAVPLLLWADMVLLLVWRMPPKLGFFRAGAYVAGFGVWMLVLGRLLASCNPRHAKPPMRRRTSSYAAALLIPFLVVGSALFVVHKLLILR